MFYSSCKGSKWCRGVVVKHGHSQHRGHEFDSFMRHNKNTIGEEGNGKPSHEFHYPRNKTQIPVSGFCYARNRVCNVVVKVVEVLAVVIFTMNVWYN